MNKNGTILIIDDDEDDLMILKEILSLILNKNKFHNKVVTYNDSLKAYDCLSSCNEAPFLIISDINMPKMDGITLRKRVKQEACTSVSCAPYVFLSTAADDQSIIERAYNLSIQGFFTKPKSFANYESLLERIILYWKNSNLPPQSFHFVHSA